jgi:hypothetical protein
MKKGPSDQITKIEKKQIRSRAERFAIDILKIPMIDGLQVYQEVIKELYDNKARIRFCLKCGEIDSTEKISKKDHKCTRVFDALAFPYLVTTSWLRMRAFFLGEKYTEILQKLGFEPLVIEKIPVTTISKAEIGVEEVPEEPANIPEET